MNEHERSENHRLAEKCSRKELAIVSHQLDDHEKEQQRQRRQGLFAHLNTMKTLLYQGLSVREHKDEDSNIWQFNKDKAVDHACLKRLLEENKFFSHDILT